MVRTLLEEGREFEQLDLPAWRRFSPLFEADIADAVRAASAVRARRTPQSTRPEAVAAALADTDAWVAQA